MPRTKKESKTKLRAGRTGDSSQVEEAEDQDLPSDEAGRLKIKGQYENLLGIRIEKLKGQILNREKINKTIEGIYYICFECRSICHNLDEGLVQDPVSKTCFCSNCGKKKHFPATATGAS